MKGGCCLPCLSLLAPFEKQARSSSVYGKPVSEVPASDQPQVRGEEGGSLRGGSISQ